MKRRIRLAVGALSIILVICPAHAQARRSVTLNAATLKSGLVRTTTLRLETVLPGIAAYGTVIDPTPVIALRSRIIAAQAELTLADANLARTRKLYRAAGNVSEASLQQAEAHAAVARSDLVALQETGKARFGIVLGTAIDNGGIPFHRIATGGSLVSVVYNITPLALPPPDARATTQDGSQVALQSIGLAGRIPKGLLGQAFLYTGPTLAIGTSLAVTLNSQNKLAGYNVPAGTLVWHDDSAFVFVRVKPRRFTMYKITTGQPVRQDNRVTGYFVSKADLPDKPVIVSSGAGLLNSALTGGSHAASGGD